MSKRTVVIDERGRREERDERIVRDAQRGHARSGIGTNVPGAWTLRRRFFVERHTLPFGKLIEAALNTASMEEPFLPALVPDEPESAIPDEPLYRAFWHGATPCVAGLALQYLSFDV
jgi:hypothetical protein